jgi:maltooligosyltrehalose trehalohydrolase
MRSKLNHRLRQQGRHKVLWELYQELINLRKTHPSFTDLDSAAIEVATFGDCLAVRRSYANSSLTMICNFGDEMVLYDAPAPSEGWHKILDSAEEKWMGPGASIRKNMSAASASQLLIQPKSFCLYESSSLVQSFATKDS